MSCAEQEDDVKVLAENMAVGAETNHAFCAPLVGLRTTVFCWTKIPHSIQSQFSYPRLENQLLLQLSHVAQALVVLKTKTAADSTQNLRLLAYSIPARRHHGQLLLNPGLASTQKRVVLIQLKLARSLQYDGYRHFSLCCLPLFWFLHAYVNV